MVSAQLIVHPTKGTLAELIDAHNALVRQIFATESDVLNTNYADISRAPWRDSDPTYNNPPRRLERALREDGQLAPVTPKHPQPLSEIQFVHNLLKLWGWHCLCVFDKHVERYPNVIICSVCNKPWIDPSND